MLIAHTFFRVTVAGQDIDAYNLRKKNFFDEAYENDFSFCVMRDKISLVLVRNKSKVVLPYFVLPQDANKISDATLKIFVEDKFTSQQPVEASGLIEINLPPADAPLKVTFELSKVFVDAQGNKHGLAIIFEVN